MESMEGNRGASEGDSPAQGAGEGAAGGSGGAIDRKLTAKQLALQARRAVNRQMTAERNAQKLAFRAAKRRKHVAVWAPFVAEAVAKRKGVTAQVDYVFARVTVWALHGRERVNGRGTVHDKHNTIARAYQDLAKLPEGKGVSSIHLLRRKHVVALVKHWVERGLSSSTITNRISDLRTWLDRMGKPDVVPVGNEWEMALRSAGVDTRALRRTTVATESKDWASNGIDAVALIEKVFEECEVVGSQLLMQLLFGARVRESYSANPVLDRHGEVYYFDKGTKGGRARSIQLDKEPVMRKLQLEGLERVTPIALKHPKRYLARKGDTAKQTRNHFYYICKKFGITRAALGVTAHGLRHQYLQQRYSSLTGLPAPVHNLVPARTYRELEQCEKDARQSISEEAGHFRPDISSAYISSIPALERRQKENMLATLAIVQDREDVDRLFQDFGGKAMYFTGKAAEGLEIPADYRYGLTILVDQDKTLAERQAFAEQLEALTGEQFAIAIGQSERDLPSDRLEAVLPSQRNTSPRSGT